MGAFFLILEIKSFLAQPLFLTMIFFLLFTKHTALAHTLNKHTGVARLVVPAATIILRGKSGFRESILRSFYQNSHVT